MAGFFIRGVNYIMKKFLILLLIIFTMIGIAFASEKVSVRKEIIAGGTSEDSVRWVDSTTDGGYIVAGFTSSWNEFPGHNGSNDYFLIKFSENGEEQWRKVYGGRGDDRGFVVRQTSEGGYILAGASISSNGQRTEFFGLWDGWVLKLDSNGDLEWQSSFGGRDNETIRDIIQTKDGGYIFCGYTFSKELENYHDGKDFWIVKLDRKGKQEWQKVYGGSGYDMPYSVIQTTDNGYAITGYTFSKDGELTGFTNHGNGDYWILKLSNSGSIQWSKVYGGSSWDEPRVIKQVPWDRGYIIAGVSGSADGDVKNNKGRWDAWVIKLDSNGKLQWENSYGGSQHDKAFSLQITKDRRYVFAGFTMSDDMDVSGKTGDMDGWVVKISRNGVLYWQQCFATGKGQSIESLAILNNNDTVFVGGEFTNSRMEVAGDSGRRYKDIWIVEFWSK